MQKAAGELTRASAHIESAQKGAAKSMDDELKATLEAYREYVNQFTQRVGLPGHEHLGFAEPDAARGGRDVGSVPRPDGTA